LRIGHQRAAERGHLLLAAGQRRARQFAALAERGKQFVDAPQCPGARPAELTADQQIFFDA